MVNNEIKRQEMKNNIITFMALAAFSVLASCSSDDIQTQDTTGNIKAMTFTATHEKQESSTRASLAEDMKSINWESGDKISILDGTNNCLFTLKSGEGTTSGSFEGVASKADSYTAIYPYQSEISLQRASVSHVTLPAEQTATDNGFDKNAAIMIAKSENKELQFKNVVGYIKVTPEFECSKIVLEAAKEYEGLAGTGSIVYVSGEPILEIPLNASNHSNSVTLSGNIKANHSYYIAVSPSFLIEGWSISFKASSDGKLYKRYSTKDLYVKRNKVINLGRFSIDGDYWHNPRGTVSADQEVDMGLTVEIEGKQYNAIFAKSNLTATGLAKKESDFGDYFAWAATEPWCTSYTRSPGTVTPTAWNNSKGFTAYNWDSVPYKNLIYDGCNKYFDETLEAEDDAATIILGGDWHLPEYEVWEALCNTEKFAWEMDSRDSFTGYRITNISDSEKSMFLPCAGYINESVAYGVETSCNYWSSTCNSAFTGYTLYASGSDNFQPGTNYRFAGQPLRAVRFVPVE